MTDDPFRQPRIPVGEALIEINRKLDDVLRRLAALDGKQPAHAAGAQRTTTGDLFLPGTGLIGASSTPEPDTAPVVPIDQARRTARAAIDAARSRQHHPTGQET